MSDRLQSLYDKYFEFNNEMLDDYKPLEVAAILIAQGLSIYKTTLDNESYNRMVDNISDNRDQVRKIKPTILQ